MARIVGLEDFLCCCDVLLIVLGYLEIIEGIFVVFVTSVTNGQQVRDSVQSKFILLWDRLYAVCHMVRFPLVGVRILTCILRLCNIPSYPPKYNLENQLIEGEFRQYRISYLVFIFLLLFFFVLVCFKLACFFFVEPLFVIVLTLSWWLFALRLKMTSG